MTLKELSDIVKIYNPDCSDYKLVLWEPYSQKQYNLVFTGSNKVDKEINFNINEIAISEVHRENINRNNRLLILYREAAIIKKEIDKLENHYIECQTDEQE